MYIIKLVDVKTEQETDSFRLRFATKEQAAEALNALERWLILPPADCGWFLRVERE